MSCTFDLGFCTNKQTIKQTYINCYLMSMAKGSPNSVEQTNGNCQQINKHIDQCSLLFI